MRTCLLCFPLSVCRLLLCLSVCLNVFPFVFINVSSMLSRRVDWSALCRLISLANWQLHFLCPFWQCGSVRWWSRNLRMCLCWSVCLSRLSFVFVFVWSRENLLSFHICVYFQVSGGQTIFPLLACAGSAVFATHLYFFFGNACNCDGCELTHQWNKGKPRNDN